MGDIFQNTESISFGSTPSSGQNPSGHAHHPPRKFPLEKPKKRIPYEGKVLPREPKKDFSRPVRDITPSEEVITNPLVELVENMKPTFFPPISTDITRCILLSDPQNNDPMMLLKTPDTSLLIGMGANILTIQGVQYPTFPDMRIVYSEKERISGWILTKVPDNFELFKIILDSLNFPPVYGSRGIIANIRDNLKGEEILVKCRFFELFSDTNPERKIRSITLSSDASDHLVYTLPGLTLIDTLHICEGESASVPNNRTWKLVNEGGFILKNETISIPCEPGETLLLDARKIEKHPLKFILDTFYLDRKSIGVVAGYTLKDRTELAQNGILIFVLQEDHAHRAILGHIYIDSRGFVHAHEMIRIHKMIISGIRRIYENTIEGNRTIERPELVAIFRKEVMKLCFLLTGRTPIIMPIIEEF